MALKLEGRGPLPKSAKSYQYSSFESKQPGEKKGRKTFNLHLYSSSTHLSSSFVTLVYLIFHSSSFRIFFVFFVFFVFFFSGPTIPFFLCVPICVLHQPNMKVVPINSADGLRVCSSFYQSFPPVRHSEAPSEKRR